MQVWYIWPMMHLDCSGVAGVRYVVHQLVSFGKTHSLGQDFVTKAVAESMNSSMN